MHLACEEKRRKRERCYLLHCFSLGLSGKSRASSRRARDLLDNPAGKLTDSPGSATKFRNRCRQVPQLRGTKHLYAAKPRQHTQACGDDPSGSYITAGTAAGYCIVFED
jgi:hypothetical protein